MNQEERIRTGSRNRQLRLIAEFWILIVPVTAIAIALLLPVIQWIRMLYNGGLASKKENPPMRSAGFR